MRHQKWFVAAALATLLAVPGLASAHSMNKEGSQCFKRCISSMCAGKDARLCGKTLSKAFMADRADLKTMHELHEKMQKVMSARRFDKKSFLALTDRMADVHSAMMRRHAAAFATVAARLAPRERKELMRKFFRATMKMAHHGMMQHKEKETHDWFSHLNK